MKKKSLHKIIPTKYSSIVEDLLDTYMSSIIGALLEQLPTEVLKGLCDALPKPHDISEAIYVMGDAQRTNLDRFEAYLANPRNLYHDYVELVLWYLLCAAFIADPQNYETVVDLLLKGEQHERDHTA